MKWTKSIVSTLIAIAIASTAAAQAEPLRIGYWTSGVSVGFGSVLETQGFLKDAGVDATFIRFSDVNAPTRALAANAIDLAFGGAAAGVFSTASDGVPIKIFLATQPADVRFVVPADSPITSMAQLRGKKIGMSPAGSSVASIAQAVLAGNHGIGPADFSLVGGNESRLAVFIAQKQIDAAALRSVTLEQIKELNVRELSTFAEEWKMLTKSDSVPYLGVGVVRSEVAEKQPETVAKVIVAMREALAWGEKHPDKVAAVLQKAANLKPVDAQAYAGLWNKMNRVALEPADIETLRREYQLFADADTIKGKLPADLFITGPYELSKTIK